MAEAPDTNSTAQSQSQSVMAVSAALRRALGDQVRDIATRAAGSLRCLPAAGSVAEVCSLANSKGVALAPTTSSTRDFRSGPPLREDADRLAHFGSRAVGPGASARTFASGGEAGDEEPHDKPQEPGVVSQAEHDVVYPKNYEEIEDEIYEMAEDLLPNIHKPLYNVWDALPESQRGIVEWSEGAEQGDDEGDLFSDLYDADQWDGAEAEVADAEGTVGLAMEGTGLEKVSDLKDTVFQWEYYLVLHPQATALPRHPKNDKVRLTIQLENLRSYYGLTEAQKSHIALICGPRYTSRTDSILLTTQVHRSRADNQRHLMKMVTDLVEEAKTFVPAP